MIVILHVTELGGERGKELSGDRKRGGGKGERKRGGGKGERRREGAKGQK